MSISAARERTGLIASIAERVGRTNAVLAVIAGAYLMIALDSTVVNVALPHIQRDLQFSTTGLAWVVNAYLLTFGGLLLLGGRIGDVVGRRRVFTIGISLFTASSVLAGLAPTAAWLVAARALQGVGAALTTPSTMALLATNFEQGPARNRALSIYSAVAMAGASAGLVVGGIITTYASWRWSLLLNLPIGAAIVGLAPRLLEDTARRPGRIDLPGALVSTVAMGTIVFGLIRAGSNGWDETSWATLAGGVLLLGVFALLEVRAQQPIVPLHLLRSARRVGAYLDLLLLPAAIFGPFFFLTQFLQEFRGFDPLAAGAAFLPQTIATIFTVRFAPRLLARFGAVRMLVAASLLVAIGVAWLTQLAPDSTYVSGILVPLILIGLGAGWCFVPLNVTILSGVASAEAGAASAVAQAMQWVGGSLGLAILVTVFGTATQAATRAATEGATQAAAHGASAAISVSPSAARIFTDGSSSAFTVGVVFALAIVGLTLTFIARRAES